MQSVYINRIVRRSASPNAPSIGLFLVTRGPNESTANISNLALQSGKLPVIYFAILSVFNDIVIMGSLQIVLKIH